MNFITFGCSNNYITIQRETYRHPQKYPQGADRQKASPGKVVKTAVKGYNFKLNILDLQKVSKNLWITNRFVENAQISYYESKKGSSMRYPNAYKGITKVLISEIMTIILSIYAVIGLTSLGEELNNKSEDVALAGLAVSILGITIAAVVALIIYLVGLVQAKKDEYTFKRALIMTLIALLLEIADLVFEYVNPAIGEWCEFGSEVFELLAFEGVVSGVEILGVAIGNEKILSIGKKMRVVVTIIWVALIGAKLMEFISDDISEVVKYINGIMEVIDHVLYVILLFTGRKMLKLAKLEDSQSVV